MRFVYVRVPAANVRNERDGPRRRAPLPSAVRMENGDIVVAIGSEESVIDLIADGRARVELEAGSCIDEAPHKLDRGSPE